MAEQNTVDIVIYFGGQWIISNDSVGYDRPPIGFINISRTTTFVELELMLYEELGFSRNDFKLQIHFKYITLNFGQRKEAVMPIKKDRDLQYFFNPMTGYVSIDIFVQAEKIREMVVPDDPAVSEWSTYMSMLTQELSSVPVVTQSMGRFGINDDYPGPSSYASPSDYAGPSSFAGPSDYTGTSSHAGPSVSNEQDDEPEADSFLNNEHVNSEPDEVEVEGLTTNNPENNDEVSIEVMIDVLGNTANDVPADSIDIPTGAWGNFYDSNTGELAIGMVFKSKDHLKASVQDFSVRYARQEYRMVESKPKLWKVACKYDQQTGCSWMLRGIFQPNMGLFKITKYAGPHTCLMNQISFEHGNLGKSMIATVGDDANQQVLPLAFALVDEESLASWRWFLQMLAKHLLPNDDDRVCLISDRHSGLISAINYVPAFKFPRGVHRFCLRHVCSNFNKKFNNIRLKDLCWRAGAEVNARKFERIMTEIRELNEEAYNWLGMIDKTQWTLTLIVAGARGSHTYVVKLKHKTCSCGKWGTHGIPCSHAIQVSRHFGVNASNFIPQYYSIRAYRKTYQGRFEPLYGEEYWDPVDIELVHNPAVRVRRGPGRYVSMRIPNEMDRPQARARQQYQSRQV
ncbi:UNVERIFIED_CONTAM: hypothetical protein Sangu_1279900 [Sesamum angustifolium]|uniref:SWIM-type domain-containing protein n=1 Tax=Sesamum angustifolium TaxID=2727405 RepID=A0AAW2NKC5_9LAMI